MSSRLVCRWAREPVGLARRATYFHLLAQMKVGKAKCLNASDPIELHGKKIRLMTSGSVPAPARPPRRLARNESASARRVSTLTQQPHPLAEALDSNRWRLALCFG